MSQNEEGSETEWICTWVPCVDYEREREREREKQAKKYHHKEYPKKRKENVCMHEICMSMLHAKKITSWVQPNPILTTHKFQL